MKITKDTLNKIPEDERGLVENLLEDIREVNKYLDNEIYLEWQDWHNEYSPERTDPCPDYYGCYTVRREGISDILGIEMTLQDLDISLCLLHNFVCYHD